MKPASEAQLRQRRMLNAQDYRHADHRYAERGQSAQPIRAGNANIGTDDDVRAYCARMGYLYETTTKSKERMR